MVGLELGSNWAEIRYPTSSKELVPGAGFDGRHKTLQARLGTSIRLAGAFSLQLGAEYRTLDASSQDRNYEGVVMTTGFRYGF